jgi:hypothetical protein
MQAAGADVSERATKVPNSSIVTFEAMVEIAQDVCWQQWHVGHCDVFESRWGRVPQRAGTKRPLSEVDRPVAADWRKLHGAHRGMR